jgi:hypothetical protein
VHALPAGTCRRHANAGAPALGPQPHTLTPPHLQVDLDLIWELLLPFIEVLLSGPPLEGAARDVLRDAPEVRRAMQPAAALPGARAASAACPSLPPPNPSPLPPTPPRPPACRLGTPGPAAAAACVPTPPAPAPAALPQPAAPLDPIDQPAPHPPQAFFETADSQEPLPWVELRMPPNVKVTSFSRYSYQHGHKRPGYYRMRAWRTLAAEVGCAPPPSKPTGAQPACAWRLARLAPARLAPALVPACARAAACRAPGAGRTCRPCRRLRAARRGGAAGG